MLLWNYEFLPPLEPLLALPSPSVAVAAASLTSAIIVVDDVVVHRVPILRSSLLASARRRAWRVVTPLALLATVDPEEVDVASRHFQLRLSPLLRLPHRDKHDTVALLGQSCLSTRVGVPVHFQLSCTTCGSPQKRPFNGRTFFCCISSPVSSQATTRALLGRGTPRPLSCGGSSC